VSAQAARPWKRRPESFLGRRGGGVELLRVPAALFGMVTEMRAALFDRGWLPTTRLEVPVISVGNLTAGGTGKTPFVLYLTRELRGRGRRPGILSRGYRAARAGEENDEGRMLRLVLPDVPHVQDPDRVAGGRELVRNGVDVIVLDDGFQHRRLWRQLDLVLIDALRPWGLPRVPDGDEVRALLPRGLLREKPHRLRRAHALVLTRSDSIDDGERARLCAELERLAPGVPILQAVHRPVRVRGPRGSAHPTTLRGREVDLVSGIGNPDGFEAAVRGLGAAIGEHRAFPDHHAYAPGDLEGLGEGGRWLLTTAKDAVKLDACGAESHVLEVELELVAGAAVLHALLDALPTGDAERLRANLHEGLHG